MGLRNRVICVVGELRSADDMAPVRADSVTTSDLDDGLRLGTGLSADHVVAVDILDRVVVGRGSDSRELALVLAVDRDFLWTGLERLWFPGGDGITNLEDGVRLNGKPAGKEGGQRELHGDG